MADEEKLQKHLAALGDNTSGGSHDAVTFAGKGLQVLRDLFKHAKKDDYEGTEEDEDEGGEGQEEPDDKRKKKSAMKKKASSRAANGGDLEEEDEEGLSDPGQEGDEDIIANRGEHKKGKGAVKKSAPVFDERRFEKSMREVEERNEDVLDASDALADLSKSMRLLAKNAGAGLNEIQDGVVAIGGAVRELLKSQASLAADIELIKKQPAAVPSPGFIVLTKNGDGKIRTLKKSEIEDAVTDAVNQGLVDGKMLSQLGSIRSQDDLKAYVDALPAKVQEML